MTDWELRNCPFLNRSWVHLLVLVTPAIETLSLLRASAPVNAPKSRYPGPASDSEPPTQREKPKPGFLARPLSLMPPRTYPSQGVKIW